MAEIENGKDLISVLWSGADILRSKMDANEYKDYLLGIVFYKYLSDSFLIRAYDLINDEKPESLTELEDEKISVDYAEFIMKYNQRDNEAREKTRDLVDSDANKVTNVFSTLF